MAWSFPTRKNSLKKITPLFLAGLSFSGATEYRTMNDETKEPSPCFTHGMKQRNRPFVSAEAAQALDLSGG